MERLPRGLVIKSPQIVLEPRAAAPAHAGAR